jgi:hypothetical protein
LHDPGLAASPPERYIFEWEGAGNLLSPCCPLWPDKLRAKRRCAAYGGTVGPGGPPLGLRMQPRSEKFFTRISKASPNVVECAAMRAEFVAAPRERWAQLATRMRDTEHAGDDTT